MSFATWVLNWGFIKFEDAYESAGLKAMMCDMMKWPMDYLLKAWRPDEQIAYALVGLNSFTNSRK